MKRRHGFKLILAASLLSTGSLALAKGESQAGGLPALAERLAALEAQVAELQGGGAPDYTGSYHVALYETGMFGCNQTTDPAGVPYLQYFQPQGISSVTTRTATTVAVSDGSSLHFPEYGLHSQEIRLSGRYEEDDRIEGNFSVDINASGSLSMIAAGPDASVEGQMSASGDSFTIVAYGRFDENGCDDAWSLMVVGNRITD
ncbi:MAG: hypothetical protein KDI36_03495 [Pseudomonadales bacterium]|nr:hypothetical protein [Pseudomonadales bacterium]